MARSRNIKPGFFTNDELGELPPLARLLFVGLWLLADREGRLKDRPKKIKAEILPYDACDVEAMLDALATPRMIIRYEVDGERYIQIPKFCDHQNPHHMEAPSKIPPLPGKTNRYNHEPIGPKQRARIYDRDGYKCVFCGSNEKLQIDHIVMVAHGGSSNDEDLRTLCSQCNNKRSKSPKPQINRADSLNLIPLTLNPITDSLNPITSTPSTPLSGKPDEEKIKINGKANYYADAMDVLNYLNNATGKGFDFKNRAGELTAGAEKIIQRLKQGYTPTELREVVFSKCQQWGNDEKMAEYLRPSTLFGKEKFEQYIGELKNAVS